MNYRSEACQYVASRTVKLMRYLLI